MANNAAQFLESKIEFGQYIDNVFIPDESSAILSEIEGTLTLKNNNTTCTGAVTIQNGLQVSKGIKVLDGEVIQGVTSSAVKWENARTLSIKAGSATIGSIKIDGTTDVTLTATLLNGNQLRDINGATVEYIHTTTNGLLPGTAGTSLLGDATHKFNQMWANTVFANLSSASDPTTTILFSEKDEADPEAPVNISVKVKDVVTTKYSEDEIRFYKNLNMQTGTSITADKVLGAWFNDMVDLLDVEDSTEITAGKAYVYDGATHRIALKTAEKGSIGICSDTYGFAVGKKENMKQLPIAIGGIVLAHIDNTYEVGTPLVSGRAGVLTKAPFWVTLFKPERIIAIMYKLESNMKWGDVVVDGRHWVKVL